MLFLTAFDICIKQSSPNDKMFNTKRVDVHHALFKDN